MANDYCSSSDVKAQLPESGLNSTTDYDDQLTVLITGASRLIDNEVGFWPGYFYPTTDSETRYFDGNGEQEIDVDHIVTLTSVSVSEEGNYSSSDYTAWTLNTDFYTWPYNATALTQPIQRLIVDHNGDKGNWTRWKKAIQIVGIFGYSSSTPNAIKQACIIQVARWYMRAKQAFQDGGANIEIGQMTYVKRLDPDVKELLWPYMLGNGR